MKVIFSVLLVVAAMTAAAQKSEPQLQADISTSRLQVLDALLERSVSDGDVPGLVALVARNGKIVYHKAFGMANAETGRQQATDDIFRIASQTKAITSTAVMMLWEEGKFRLDDPISKYIPEFKEVGVLDSFWKADTSYTTTPAKREITIRDLLTHTSGLGYGFIDGDERMKMIYEKAGTTDIFTTEDVTIGDFVKRLARLPLHHHPGERFTYSVGIDVLGYLVEILSGMPFDRFLHDRIFTPLGMHDTYFYLPDDKAARLVPIQRREGDRWVNFTEAAFNTQYPVEGARSFFSGGGGLSSTATDYAAFLQLYLNGGELNGTRLLSRTTIETIMANQTGTLFGNGRQYHGLAFAVLAESGRAVGGLGSPGTFEWGGYFNTQYFADPEAGVIGVLLKQTQGPVNDQTAWKFKQVVGTLIDD